MNAIKINDDLYINIDAIYSIQHITNNEKQNAWTEAVENAFKSDNFKEYVEKNNIVNPQDNIENIYNIIISQIGECPQIEHTYIFILVTGVKITVDENIYNTIKNYMDNLNEARTTNL